MTFDLSEKADQTLDILYVPNVLTNVLCTPTFLFLLSLLKGLFLPGKILEKQRFCLRSFQGALAWVEQVCSFSQLCHRPPVSCQTLLKASPTIHCFLSTNTSGWWEASLTLFDCLVPFLSPTPPQKTIIEGSGNLRKLQHYRKSKPKEMLRIWLLPLSKRKPPKFIPAQESPCRSNSTLNLTPLF